MRGYGASGCPGEGRGCKRDIPGGLAPSPRLPRLCGGQCLYIPKAESMEREARDREGEIRLRWGFRRDPINSMDFCVVSV